MALIKVGDIFITNQGCRAKVVEYISYKKILIEFDDEHKHRMYTYATNLKKGQVSNPFYRSIYGVGYIGFGQFNVAVNRKATYEYLIWKAMLQRCYSDVRHEIDPTYKNCTVCDEWHNFQVFAEWYTNHEFYGLGYQLDKDLLIDGNKVYSPETCSLVPSPINNLFLDSGAKRGEYPIGVHYSKRDNVFVARLNINGRKTHLGHFDSPIKASEAYQKAKKEYVKQKALEWQNRIDERLFNALMAKAA